MPRTSTTLVMRPILTRSHSSIDNLLQTLARSERDDGMDCGMDHSEDTGPQDTHMGLPGIVPMDRSPRQEDEGSPIPGVHLVKLLEINIKMGKREDDDREEENENETEDSVEDRHERSSGGLDEAMAAMMGGAMRQAESQPESASNDEFKILPNTSTKVDLRK